MKKLVGLAVFCAVSFNAQALPLTTAGSTNSSVSGDEVTFTFDLLNSDIRAENSLTFGANGIDFTVTQSGGKSINQDFPANGGLGVDDRDNVAGNHGDNLGGDEMLMFSFSGLVDLMGFTLNGQLGSTGHTEAASGFFDLSSSSDGSVTTLNNASADEYDGVGDDHVLNGMLADVGLFQGRSSFTFSTGGDEGFHGYVESITVRKATVPEPATLGLLGLGLVSLVAFRRRQNS